MVRFCKNILVDIKTFRFNFFVHVKISNTITVLNILTDQNPLKSLTKTGIVDVGTDIANYYVL